VKLHGNAKLTPVQRRLLVSRVLEEHWTFPDVADAFGVNEPRIGGWLDGAQVTVSSRIGRRHRSVTRGGPLRRWND
jgi:leucine-zipper of insertion element IS481